MNLRSLVRVAIVLAIVGVPVFSARMAAAQTPAPREQTRLGKMSVLKAGLKAMVALQDPSGGFPPGLDNPIDPRATAAALSMLIALRNEGIDVETDAALAYLQQTDPVAWAESQAVTVTDSEVARIVIGLVAAGGDPKDVGGNDLIALLEDSWNADAGIYGEILFDSPLIAMALTVAGEPVEDAAIETFAAKQLDGGAWGAYGEATDEPYTSVTAFVVQTLVAVGRGDDPMIDDAVAFLRTVQTEEGSFTTEPGRPGDAYTTGLVISALIAAGENLKSEEWAGAVTSLLGWQNESGAFRGGDLDPYDNPTVTFQALIALSGAYWPVLPLT